MAWPDCPKCGWKKNRFVGMVGMVFDKTQGFQEVPMRQCSNSECRCVYGPYYEVEKDEMSEVRK